VLKYLETVVSIKLERGILLPNGLTHVNWRWNSLPAEVLCAPVVGVPLRREGDAQGTDVAGRRRRLEEAPCVGQRAGAARAKEDQRGLRRRRAPGRRLERIGLHRSLDELVLVCFVGSLGHWIHASREKIWSDFLLPISSGTVLPTLLLAGVV